MKKVEAELENAGARGVEIFISDLDFEVAPSECPGLGGWKRVDLGWMTRIHGPDAARIISTAMIDAVGDSAFAEVEFSDLQGDLTITRIIARL